MEITTFIDLSKDIYYQQEYSALYEWDGKIFEYLYNENDYFVKFRALKRKITSVAGELINEELYDLETPYGYGGPRTNCSDDGFLARAFASYRAHCKQHNIVSEFIRFHPFNKLAENSMLFDMHALERQVVIVDLTLNSEERRQLYSKKTRGIINKASKELTISIDDVELSEFTEMYYETMKKNKADAFFYFDECYFEKLMQIDGVNLIAARKDKNCASIGFFLCSNDLAHYHLSANNQRFAKENGNYLLLDAAFEYAKTKGCKYMMLGGGRTSSQEDGLFKFKSKFSPATKPFYIAGLSFWPEKHQYLNQIWLEKNIKNVTPEIFQLYRV